MWRVSPSAGEELLGFAMVPSLDSAVSWTDGTASWLRDDDVSKGGVVPAVLALVNCEGGATSEATRALKLVQCPRGPVIDWGRQQQMRVKPVLDVYPALSPITV